jgi:hypothetical protein
MRITIVLTKKNYTALNNFIKEHIFPYICHKMNLSLNDKNELDRLCNFFCKEYLVKDDEFSTTLFSIDKDNIEYIYNQYQEYSSVKVKGSILHEAIHYLIIQPIIYIAYNLGSIITKLLQPACSLPTEVVEKEYMEFDTCSIFNTSKNSESTSSTIGKIFHLIDELNQSSLVESIAIVEEANSYEAYISDFMINGGYWFV